MTAPDDVPEQTELDKVTYVTGVSALHLNSSVLPSTL
jgi:hypothetical protein